MLERFNKKQLEIIKSCAEVIHSVETGTANQRNINALFDTSYFFTDPEDDWEDNIRDVQYARNENNQRGNYTELVNIISEKFPEMNKAYLPFMVSDVLREAYTKYNNEVKENV